MMVLFDFCAFSQQFINENQWAAWFARGILTRTAKEIEKLQRFSTKNLSVKEDLEPGADVTPINFEFGLCTFVERSVV